LAWFEPIEIPKHFPRTPLHPFFKEIPMLIQILTQQPHMLGAILKGTPVWVWGLLAALLALGASQLPDRKLSLPRVTMVPIAMLGFALFGMVSAFGNSGQPGQRPRVPHSTSARPASVCPAVWFRC
jgi:hypothetical protein